jgi:uncharacterized protein YggT (Ycf19 family)
MLVLSHLLSGLALVLHSFLLIYQILLIARAVTSWVSANPRNPIVAFLTLVTEPAIRLIRRRLPTNLRYFPLDIAFLVLFALVLFLDYGLVPLLSDYAFILRRSALSGPSGPSEIY